MFLDSPAPSLSFLLPASSQGISACWAAGAARERGLGTVQCTCFPLSSTCTCTFTVGEKCVDLLRALACAPKVGGGKIPEVLWDTRGCLRASDLEGARAPQGLRFPQYSRVVQNVLFDLFMFMMSVYVYDVGISFQLVGTTALFTSGCWRSHREIVATLFLRCPYSEASVCQQRGLSLALLKEYAACARSGIFNTHQEESVACTHRLNEWGCAWGHRTHENKEI